MGFIKYGVFPADNGCFSITLSVPEIEETLRLAVMRPEIFDRICQLLPAHLPAAARRRPLDRRRPVRAGQQGLRHG